jgi:undecaprenyl diphosphate synthase
MSSQQLRHVSIIMDGNGRWAKQYGLPRVAGHKVGLESMKSVIEAAVECNLEVLSLFAFSIDNWQRSSDEVNYILETLLFSAFKDELEKLHRNNIRLTFIGDRARLNAKQRAKLDEAEELTDKNSGLRLVIALSYSGRWDITNALTMISAKIVTGELKTQEITEQVIGKYLSCADLPAPDLLIRTSGEQRLSNFMLWQLAYTEFYFTTISWPDFRKEEFIKALESYKNRERRFGR